MPYVAACILFSGYVRNVFNSSAHFTCSEESLFDARSGDEVEYFEEFPVNLIHRLPDCTGRSFDEIIVLNLQYGTNFSGPGKDVFRLDRATGEASDAHNSNFLHPVFYHYKKLPTGKTCRYGSRFKARHPT